VQVLLAVSVPSQNSRTIALYQGLTVHQHLDLPCFGAAIGCLSHGFGERLA